MRAGWPALTELAGMSFVTTDYELGPSDFKIPLIYVTHDATELGALCDEVLVLESGRFIRRGSPDCILDPASGH